MVTDGNRPLLERSFENVRRLVPAPANEQTLTGTVSERLRPAKLGEWSRPSTLRSRPSIPKGTDGLVSERLPGQLPLPDLKVRLSPVIPDARPDLPVFRPEIPVDGSELPVNRPETIRIPSASVRTRLSAVSLDREQTSSDSRSSLSPPSLPVDGDGITDGDRFESRLYDTQTTTPEYFVGVIPAGHETVVGRLEDSAFGVSRVSYPKALAEAEADCPASSSWVYRSWPLSHFQLHLVLFELPGEEGESVYAFYHHEYNWLRHPVGHLSAEYLNPEWGRDTTVDLLETADIPIRTCEDIDDRYPRANDFCTSCGEPA